MTRTRPKPPAENKAELMHEIVSLLKKRYGDNAEMAVLYLLNFFTSIDLVGIREDLKTELRKRGK